MYLASPNSLKNFERENSYKMSRGDNLTIARISCSSDKDRHDTVSIVSYRKKTAQNPSIVRAVRTTSKIPRRDSKQLQFTQRWTECQQSQVPFAPALNERI